MPTSDSFCEVDVLAKPVIEGAAFEVVDVNCDTLAKDETIRVYALTRRKSLFGGLQDQSDLLFSYDPGSRPNTQPQISADAGGAIAISVPRISSISYKADQWAGKPIQYSIGGVDYP